MGAKAAAVSCGIDFGTTNSVVAVAAGEERSLVRLEGDHVTLPSALFFPPRGLPDFGRAAVDRYLGGDDGRLMRGLKKILGTSLMQEKTNLGAQSLSFVAIVQVFLTRLRQAAIAEQGAEIDHVVMGRPVHFHDYNHDADNMAQDTLGVIARAAGFKHVEFLYEPIAAAFAHEAQVEGEKIALVVDLGGGTSDFTAIRLSKARMNAHDRSSDILATSGVRVGGTTFDYRLSMDSFMPHLGMNDEYHDRFDDSKWLPMPRGVYQHLSDWPFVHMAQTHQAIRQTREILPRCEEPLHLERLLAVQEQQRGHGLLAAVEEAKIALTQAAAYDVSLPWMPEGGLYEEITRAAFEEAIDHDVVRVTDALRECMEGAGLRAEDVGLVIMTGGSTALPLIRARVGALFPAAQFSYGNMLDSVGLGLAYHSGRIFA